MYKYEISGGDILKIIFSAVMLGYFISYIIWTSIYVEYDLSVCDQCKIVYIKQNMNYCNECGGKLTHIKDYDWRRK